MVFPQALANINRYITNPAASVVAGRVPGFGIVLHKGRKSGRAYRTPVVVFERNAGYRIALTYGRNVDWVKNIRAAGDFALETRGRVVELTEPVIRCDPSMDWAPLGVRQVLRAISADYYLDSRPVD
ncbi:nitroreductase family deazaflavin-dependent oxidoreductase [Nocardia sp. CNY236]|uniref:nitroreductase family deazaflavin-dependent oxidoreductase n=1 Tax=Nocardia sp. CNY236 TaxID=1169152 RepID=UPI0004080FBC|nr:nitroreductase family deazaflavin-dependent oxidoreductase [Nocardia sp. CNY236]